MKVDETSNIHREEEGKVVRIQIRGKSLFDNEICENTRSFREVSGL